MKLEKKYGLLMAIAMVVGTVIGSGAFYKAQTVLATTGGNMTLGVIAWLVVGIIMLICLLTFANLATKYSKVNGLVDYAEAVVGKDYGSVISWFLAVIFYPSMTGVVSWVTARFFGDFFGWPLNGLNVMILAGALLIIMVLINVVAPKVAEKFQISATVIKLIPLITMGIVGLIYGVCKTIVNYEIVDGIITNTGQNQMQILIDNFKVEGNSGFKVFLSAIVSVAFAYEGWTCATSISGELKNSKRNLPIALVLGGIIIIAIYVLYFIGVAGGATSDVLITGGTQYAFYQIFGDIFGVILNAFVVISCLGTLNGLTVATSRSFYAMAERNMGPRPDLFIKLNPKTNMPTASAIIGLILSALWLIYFYGANLAPKGWFGLGAFDNSELPIITIYALYIPLFIMMIKNERKYYGKIKGIILPILSVISCLFMVFAAIYAHGIKVVFYLIVFTILMSIGLIYLFKNKKKENNI